MDGKAYYRAVRGHMLTYKALWQLHWHLFCLWLTETDRNISLSTKVESTIENFSTSSTGNNDDIQTSVNHVIEALEDENILQLIEEFDDKFSNIPNFVLWRTYMRVVETLFDFIRRNRDGDWLLHLNAFAEMLPWMTIYDHTNYAQWGPVYLVEMKCLETSHRELYQEFMSGNFVVKGKDAKFNQIPIDQATKWQNKICKISNGILGIARNDTARDKFCITWAERSFISHSTRILLDLVDDSDENISTRKDAQQSRKKFDTNTIENLKKQLIRFDVFKLPISKKGVPIPVESHNYDDQTRELKFRLIPVATNDVATDEIQENMLFSESRGKQLVSEHVRNWFVRKDVPFFDALKKNNSKTFKAMYQTKIQGKQSEQKFIKADRKLLQRLLTVSMAGRQVKIDEILQHGLSSLPLSLAKINGDMNFTSKSDMIDIVSGDIEFQHSVKIDVDVSKVCTLIDGHALVQALGKPQNCKTFGDYANAFFKAVTSKLVETVERVDILFDTYIEMSIKAAARAKRNTTKRPIRRIIDREDRQLPHVWGNFIALSENKPDLVNFLSEYAMQHARV